MGINEIQTHRAVGDCIDTAMLISAATLKQYDKADTQLNTMTDATLEDRYTAAMAMFGYEKVIADDENVSIIFGKSGDEIGFDSWALVGDYLEDIFVSDMAVDNYSAYKKLIHPEGRIKYEVLSDKDGNQIFDDFEEALSCYIKIGDTDNKTIKFVNTGNDEKIEIAHKFGNEANNVLNNYYNSIFAKSNLTVNERDKFCIALNISSYKLKRNNIYNILNKAFDELIYSAKSNIVRSNSVDGEWSCIIANDKRPQDYTSINIIGTPIDNKLEVTVAVMHANEVIDAKKISAHVNLTDENSINGLFRSVYDNFKDFICNAPDSLDTDYDSPMISYNNDEIEKFMEKLEEHEYYEIPDLSDIEIKNISEGNPPNDEIIKKRRTR